MRTNAAATADQASTTVGVNPGDPAAALASLTQALRKFSVEQRRVPSSLSEVVAAGYIKNMPPAPPGKKFAISPRRLEVVLVDQ